MDRAPGLSVRLKLTLSYAGFLVVAGVLLLAVVWVFLLSWIPEDITAIETAQGLQPGDGLLLNGRPAPTRGFLLGGFAPAAVKALLFLLVFGLLGGWVLAGRMLAPLRHITDATREAAKGTLSHRIELPGREDEFRELADAFDTMLAQLDAQLGEQQRFAANASHELRTPLAITQALLDVVRSDPDRETDAFVERLHTVNARAISLTEALLLLSRADQRSFARGHVDLSLMAEEAAETLLPLAEEHGVTIQTSGDITPATGSPALVLQMITNLVQNAIVHNLPSGGTVLVSTTTHRGSAVLTVENTGEQLSRELVSTLTEPFQRGRERTGHQGVGLGLAIVRSIAQAHDGTLTLAPRPGGGLHVTVRLPAST